MFSSVLIANRGEIAVRVARTAKRLGLRTIAIYSDADAGALHTQVCDEAHRIGPAPAAESYLAIDRIIACAVASGAACIHPGYGFLSENPAFAEACAGAGIAFVGPSPAAIRLMGLKDRAKALMAKSGIPVVPGYHGGQQEAAFLKRKAYEIGYPVLIKPVAGGGGKGMRRVDRHADFDAALDGAQREARGAFSDARVLIEKYVAAPRHIEFQVFGDSHGTIVHLNERDCTLQRRHQKVIEEAPAPGMNQAMRDAMGRAAIRAARAVEYVGAGTVEFIVDGSGGLSPDAFWFMEMNTRLQVEHPVTEAVTGLDLVEWQFRVAAGEPLPLRQEDIGIDGHAVEARLYAEDPEHGFLPSIGRVLAFDVPTNGVRVDSGIAAGLAVTPYYDAMIAKLIAQAPTRAAALEHLAGALDHTLVAGPRTNARFLAALLRAPDFRSGAVDTGFIERNLASLGAVPQAVDHAAIARAVAHAIAREQSRLALSRDDEDAQPSPWDATDGFQFDGPRQVTWPVSADGEPLTAQVRYGAEGTKVSVAGVPAAEDAIIIDGGDSIFVLRAGRQTVVDPMPRRADSGAADGGRVIRAPMHGKLLAVLVEPGSTVHKGQRVAIVEAMKMEHTLTAPIDGRVAEIGAAAGAQVAERAVIMVIEPAA